MKDLNYIYDNHYRNLGILYTVMSIVMEIALLVGSIVR